MMKLWLSTLSALVLAGTLATSAQALPLAKSGATEPAAVQEVGYRKCWWKYGERHCRYVSGGPSVNLYIGNGRRHYRGNRYGNRYGYRGDHRGDRRGGVGIRIR